jgi:hypothetical protein
MAPLNDAVRAPIPSLMYEGALPGDSNEVWLAELLEPTRRYSLIRGGAVEFAYTDHDRYVRALKNLWSAGLVPHPLPAVDGSQLLEASPNLRSVDADLTDLQASDVERSSRFS